MSKLKKRETRNQLSLRIDGSTGVFEKAVTVQKSQVCPFCQGQIISGEFYACGDVASCCGNFGTFRAVICFKTSSQSALDAMSGVSLDVEGWISPVME